MIVRILGHGQFDVDESELVQLNELDEKLQAAVESGDEPRFHTALAALIGQVRTAGTALADDDLRPSDVVLPDPDASIDEVRDVLGDEGLIPG